MRPGAAPPLDVNLVWLDTADSTNEVTARLVAGWAEDEDDRLSDTLVVAGTQTAGRGRGGHAWESPAGGLYATWLGWVTTAELAWLPIAAGLCLAESVESVLPDVRAEVKWPNDVVVGGRKLGGVLCQSRSRGAAAWATVGFGVNVALAPDIPAAGAMAPTSLAALGYDGEPEAAIRSVLAGMTGCLRPLLALTDELPERWGQRTIHRIGDRLKVKVNGEVLVGGYVGLAADGQLELMIEGARRCISAGGLIGELPETEG